MCVLAANDSQLPLSPENCLQQNMSHLAQGVLKGPPSWEEEGGPQRVGYERLASRKDQLCDPCASAPPELAEVRRPLRPLLYSATSLPQSASSLSLLLRAPPQPITCTQLPSQAVLLGNLARDNSQPQKRCQAIGSWSWRGNGGAGWCVSGMCQGRGARRRD